MGCLALFPEAFSLLTACCIIIWSLGVCANHMAPFIHSMRKVAGKSCWHSKILMCSFRAVDVIPVQPQKGLPNVVEGANLLRDPDIVEDFLPPGGGGCSILRRSLHHGADCHMGRHTRAVALSCCSFCKHLGMSSQGGIQRTFMFAPVEVKGIALAELVCPP